MSNLSVYDLYEAFRDRPVKRTGKVRLSIPKQLATIGFVKAIEYDTTIGPKMVPFRHRFAAGSRPHLLVGTKKGQVFLHGTRFKFTERGIVDYDRFGREVKDRHYPRCPHCGKPQDD